MEENPNDIKDNDSIKLSRNTPIALVVGAAGFLGSHLVDKLLKQGIQVIGVDNLSTGSKTFLESALEQSPFHLFEQSITRQITLKLPRLDYAFFIADIDNTDRTNLYRYGIPSFIHYIKDFSAKILLVTSIELYDKSSVVSEQAVIQAEGLFAKLIQDHQLNARIVRLSAVFGPRMHFRVKDPLIDLIKLSLQHKLQPYTPITTFSSRALYVDDAVNLLIKSMFVGATAHKIYDGAAIEPIKLDEAAQYLLQLQLDKEAPFSLTKLPTWPTPNLSKTSRELNWQPKVLLPHALKLTLDYFKGQSKMDGILPPINNPAITQTIPDWTGNKSDEPAEKKVKIRSTSHRSWLRQLSRVLIGGLIIVCLIILPLAVIYVWSTWDGLFDETLNQVESGKVSQNSKSVKLLNWELETLSVLPQLLAPLNDLPQVKMLVGNFNTSLNLRQTEDRGLIHLIQAEQALTASNQNPTSITQTLVEFKTANANFQLAKLNGQTVDQKLLDSLDAWVNLLPIATLSNFGENQYLVVVTKQTDQGPQVESVGDITDKNQHWSAKFETVGEFLNQSATNLGITPQGLIQGQDFPSFAQGLINLEKQGSQANFAGVISLNVETLSNLVEAQSGVKLDSSNQILKGSDIMNQLNGQSDQGQFLTEVSNQLFSKILTSPVSLSKILPSWYQALETGESQIYSQNKAAFSLALAQDWTGGLQSVDSNENQVSDFLLVDATKIGVFPVKSSLQTTVDLTGGIVDTLELNYQNSSSNDLTDSPVQVLIPESSTLEQATWGGKDLSSQVSQTNEFSRSVLTLPINLKVGESQALILTYQLPNSLTFNEEPSSPALYQLKLVTPNSTTQSTLNWQLTLPSGWTMKYFNSNLKQLSGNQTTQSLSVANQQVNNLYIFK